MKAVLENRGQAAQAARLPEFLVRADGHHRAVGENSRFGGSRTITTCHYSSQARHDPPFREGLRRRAFGTAKRMKADCHTGK
jgi:hypothetical protein